MEHIFVVIWSFPSNQKPFLSAYNNADVALEFMRHVIDKGGTAETQVLTIQQTPEF